jgi:hypothetical protein
MVGRGVSVAVPVCAGVAVPVNVGGSVAVDICVALGGMRGLPEIGAWQASRTSIKKGNKKRLRILFRDRVI